MEKVPEPKVRIEIVQEGRGVVGPRSPGSARVLLVISSPPSTPNQHVGEIVVTWSDRDATLTRGQQADRSNLGGGGGCGSYMKSLKN